MSLAAKVLVLFVVIFHLMAFVVETFLWMIPAVHGFALPRLIGETAVARYDQALILRTLFINQGFYNLMLAIAGATALALLARDQIASGRVLAVYACLSAVGAGCVLLVTTHAYAGAALQAGPAVAALAVMLADSMRNRRRAGARA